MAKFVKSPLKWAGGKYRLLPRIIAALPPGRRLVEPFLGSGVVFLNSDYPAYLLADLNPDVINFYRFLGAEGSAFIRRCALLFRPANNDAKAYYALRGRFNALGPGAERSAIFLYLNRHAYNGLMRYNAAGAFNTPFGRYKSPYFPEFELAVALQKLQKYRPEFATLDFRSAFKALRPGDVVYCDPPYLALSATANFTAYTGGAFGPAEQAALAKAAEAAQSRGCPVVISNHATPEAFSLYRRARIESFEVARPISCRGQGRGKVAELLAVYQV